MKRATAVIGAIALASIVFLMVTAGTAMAACNGEYPPSNTCVANQGDTNANVVKSAGDAADTAFTGSNVSMWMVLVGVLVVAGVGTLLIARRRSAANHGE
jgi:LPXTG-motif cell wall-anchored protein